MVGGVYPEPDLSRHHLLKSGPFFNDFFAIPLRATARSDPAIPAEEDTCPFGFDLVFWQGAERIQSLAKTFASPLF
ncbi:LytTr DNA-binding domain protein [Desmospora sp. 8437]|nr:LytTr DNA-binding domain protein [Desmospora sp. 8437]